MNIPDGLLYTKEHEWVKIDDRTATIGISDYAQSFLGDITFIEPPNIEDEVEQFKPLATIESVKAASDIYAPLSGKIVKVNKQLTDSPELINQSSYEKGWLVIIEIKDESEKDNLLSPADYRNYVEGLS